MGFQKAQHTQDSIHRCTDFVRHLREEVRLGLTFLLGSNKFPFHFLAFFIFFCNIRKNQKITAILFTVQDLYLSTPQFFLSASVIIHFTGKFLFFIPGIQLFCNLSGFFSYNETCHKFCIRFQIIRSDSGYQLQIRCRVQHLSVLLTDKNISCLPVVFERAVKFLSTPQFFSGLSRRLLFSSVEIPENSCQDHHAPQYDHIDQIVFSVFQYCSHTVSAPPLFHFYCFLK